MCFKNDFLIFKFNFCFNFRNLLRQNFFCGKIKIAIPLDFDKGIKMCFEFRVSITGAIASKGKKNKKMEI